MRESRSSGSVEGVLSHGHLYSDCRDGAELRASVLNRPTVFSQYFRYPTGARDHTMPPYQPTHDMLLPVAARTGWVPVCARNPPRSVMKMNIEPGLFTNFMSVDANPFRFVA